MLLIGQKLHTPYKTLATANNVDGETSLASLLMECINFSSVSFSPEMTSAKRSVLAAHSKMSLSRACSLINSTLNVKKEILNKNLFL